MAKSCSTTLIPDLNTQLHFRLNVFLYITTIVFYSYLITSETSVSISPTNIDDYLPSDDPNFTNLMVFHYDCAKQYTLRQFNLLNVKQCTEAPSNIQHSSVKVRVYVRAKAKRIKGYKCVAYAKKNENFLFKAPSNIDVLIELYGTITLCPFLLPLIL